MLSECDGSIRHASSKVSVILPKPDAPAILVNEIGGLRCRRCGGSKCTCGRKSAARGSRHGKVKRPIRLAVTGSAMAMAGLADHHILPIARDSSHGSDRFQDWRDAESPDLRWLEVWTSCCKAERAKPIVSASIVCPRPGPCRRARLASNLGQGRLLFFLSLQQPHPQIRCADSGRGEMKSDHCRCGM